MLGFLGFKMIMECTVTIRIESTDTHISSNKTHWHFFQIAFDQTVANYQPKMYFFDLNMNNASIQNRFPHSHLFINKYSMFTSSNNLH